MIRSLARRAAVVLLIFVTCRPWVAFSQENEARLREILYNSSVSGVSFGMSQADVQALMGPPDDIGPEPFYVEYWRYSSPPTSTFVFFRPNESQVNGFSATKLDLGDGRTLQKESLDSLRDTFGRETREVDHNDYVWWFDEGKLILRILFDSDGLSRRFVLGLPKPHVRRS